MRTRRGRLMLGAGFAAFLCILCAQLSVVAQEVRQSQVGVLAASDGHGQISLLWFPQPDRWPAGGWRIEAASGKVVVPHVSLGDPEALKALPEEQAQAIRNLPQTLESSQATGKRREQLFGILAINALANPTYARALGLSQTLQGVSPGRTSYRVVGLDASGRPTGLVLTTAPLDSSVATSLPSPPSNLTARAGRDGVSLLWSPTPGTPDVPVIAYAIVRDSSAAKGVELTARPLILGTKWNDKTPAFVDQAAPAEDMLAYHVMSEDVFGRRGLAADVKIYLPDMAALDPPEPVIAQPSPEGVVVAWTSGSNPHTAGYVVERANLYDGPYEALTPQGLARDAKQYLDADVRGGTTYYYRVRAEGPRGDLGQPSHAVMIQSKNAAPPPKPERVRAELGATRVRLTWSAVPFPVAGYSVERLGGNIQDASTRPQSSSAPGGWVRLNARVTPETLFDDYFGDAANTKFSYRVIAIAYDNGESAPSEPVSIVLPDTSLPGAPIITGADGAGGRARLTFTPGLPYEKTAQFLILRGGSSRDLGVVMGDPLPASARDFVDRYVQAGSSYWYRVVAVDSKGNRSDPTDPVAVRIGSVEIATPATPAARFMLDPFPQVRIEFALPPPGMAVMVQVREGENGRWIALAGPIENQSQAVDPNPPAKDPIFYRILYRAAGGATGSPSEAVELRR